jgi:hypothetical protein
MDEIDEAHRRGQRPPTPDLPKLIAEWEKSHPRPLAEKVKGWLKN